jgi:hypothetical protein
MSASDDAEYSDYVKHASSINTLLALLCGFLFTAAAILLTRLQNPGSAKAQIGLLFLTCIFNIFLFLLYFIVDMVRFCRNLPPYRNSDRAFNVIFFLVATLFNFSTTIMFLLWDLNYLALASAVLAVITTVAAYFFIWKPFQKIRK